MKLINEINSALGVPLEQSPDQYSKIWLEFAFTEEIKEHIKSITAQNHEKIQVSIEDRQARKWISRGVFSFVILYILLVLWIVDSNHEVSDKVLITLLSTTSINIIGLLMGVVRYLFPNQKKNIPKAS